VFLDFHASIANKLEGSLYFDWIDRIIDGLRPAKKTEDCGEKEEVPQLSRPKARFLVVPGFSILGEKQTPKKLFGLLQNFAGHHMC